MLAAALTALVGTFARGKAAKAIAAGVGGAIAPTITRVGEGFATGLGDHAFTIGQMIGDGIGGLLVAAVVWIAPKNKD